MDAFDVGIPAIRLGQYLTRSHVNFSVQHHPKAITAREVAASEHVPAEEFAKSVVVVADARPYLLVIPASEHLELEGLGQRLGLGDTVVQLADETEIARLFPDCAVGAAPPLGNCYGMPVYVDSALAKHDSIVFNAGTHTETM